MKTARLNRTVDFKFGQSLRIGTLVQIAQVNENTCYLVSKDALDKPTMYFKDEGSYFVTKVEKDGTPADPINLYEFGSILPLTVTTKKEGRELAKKNGYHAEFD